MRLALSDLANAGIFVLENVQGRYGLGSVFSPRNVSRRDHETYFGSYNGNMGAVVLLDRVFEPRSCSKNVSRQHFTPVSDRPVR